MSHLRVDDADPPDMAPTSEAPDPGGAGGAKLEEVAGGFKSHAASFAPVEREKHLFLQIQPRLCITNG